MTVKEGQKAPAFTLLNQNQEKVSLKDFKERSKVVIFFYPKAMTPGCTTQACGMRDVISDMKKKKVTVLGISPDQPDKLLKFAQKYDLSYSLLSDPEHKIAEKYGIWGEKKFMGKTYMGIIRTTFIIDRNGKVQYVMEKVKTKSHHDDILEYL